MRAIRNIAVRAGYIHPFFQAQGKMITEIGRIFEDDEDFTEIRIYRIDPAAYGK